MRFFVRWTMRTPEYPPNKDRLQGQTRPEDPFRRRAGCDLDVIGGHVDVGREHGNQERSQAPGSPLPRERNQQTHGTS